MAELSPEARRFARTLLDRLELASYMDTFNQPHVIVAEEPGGAIAYGPYPDAPTAQADLEPQRQRWATQIGEPVPVFRVIPMFDPRD